MSYTVSMSFFVKSTVALPPKTKNTATIAIFLAIILLVMAIMQLVNYSGFIVLLGAYILPFGNATSIGVFAGLIVFCELLALPFLFRVRLSPAMRFLSMIAGWFAVAAWFLLQVWLNHPFLFAIGVTHTTNTGLLGANIGLTVGWWSVLFTAALGVLAGWSAWGMWPFGWHKK